MYSPLRKKMTDKQLSLIVEIKKRKPHYPISEMEAIELCPHLKFSNIGDIVKIKETDSATIFIVTSEKLHLVHP
jgi:hypothetical protein